MTHNDHFGTYLKEIGRTPLLSPDQEIQLGLQVQAMVVLQAKSPLTSHEQQLIRVGQQARDKMIKSNLRLVVAVAKKYQNRGLELLDLVQEGTLGLTVAVEKFDPTKGYRFSTYAYWWIKQTMTRAIAHQSRTIRLPVHITERLNKIKKAQRELIQLLGRSPTVAELAQKTGIKEPDLRMLLEAQKPVASLNSRLKNDDPDATNLLDLLPCQQPNPEEVLEQFSLHKSVTEMLGTLPDNERQVLELRFGFSNNDSQPLTFVEIAQRLELSRERVRQIEKKGIQRLRELALTR